MVLAPFDDLLQDRLVDLDESVWILHLTAMNTHVREGDSIAGVTKVIEHVLDEDGSLGGGAIYMSVSRMIQMR